MPTEEADNPMRTAGLLAELKRYLRNKYPKLIEGTPGWYRAMKNQRRRGIPPASPAKR